MRSQFKNPILEGIKFCISKRKNSFPNLPKPCCRVGFYFGGEEFKKNQQQDTTGMPALASIVVTLYT